MKLRHVLFSLLIGLGSPALFAATQPLDQWTYVQIDDEKAMWGDFDEPEWLRYFGLAMGDVDGDGRVDIVTGRNVYLNPGTNLTAPWKKLDIGDNVDGMLTADLAGNGRMSVIASQLPDVLRYDLEGNTWTKSVLNQIPPTGHHNGQGYRVADMIPGGHPEVIMASLGGLYQLSTEDGENWKVLHLGKDASDEGFAIGDVDGDGDHDLVAGFRVPGGDPENPLVVVWFENPDDGSEDWPRHDIGRSQNAVDRVEVGDLNGDGRLDVAVAEERYPGLEPDANLWIYLQGESGNWQRHHIVEQYSMNNLDIADMDADGDLDIVTAEHKGDRLSVQIWANDGDAGFSKTEVDHGKENHLGTRVHDMDGDGDLDIVGIGWDQHKFVHLWRNDAAK